MYEKVEKQLKGKIKLLIKIGVYPTDVSGTDDISLASYTAVLNFRKNLFLSALLLHFFFS